MTGCKRGDVVLVLFPNSDLLTFKKRPALVVQADNLAKGLPQAIIAIVNIVNAMTEFQSTALRNLISFGQCAASPCYSCSCSVGLLWLRRSLSLIPLGCIRLNSLGQGSRNRGLTGKWRSVCATAISSH